MPDYRDREATNQTIFRDLNEWTRGSSSVALVPHRHHVFVCECSDARCTRPVRLTLAEYETVRVVPTRFVVAVNHENPEIDRLVAENARFATVDKFEGSGAAIARTTDPRR